MLGFYRHTDPETRGRAEAAGVDLVVPRSRMARELPELVERAARRGPLRRAEDMPRQGRALRAGCSRIPCVDVPPKPGDELVGSRTASLGSTACAASRRELCRLLGAVEPAGLRQQVVEGRARVLDLEPRSRDRWPRPTARTSPGSSRDRRSASCRAPAPGSGAPRSRRREDSRVGDSPALQRRRPRRSRTPVAASTFPAASARHAPGSRS